MISKLFQAINQSTLLSIISLTQLLHSRFTYNIVIRKLIFIYSSGSESFTALATLGDFPMIYTSPNSWIVPIQTGSAIIITSQIKQK